MRILVILEIKKKTTTKPSPVLYAKKESFDKVMLFTYSCVLYTFAQFIIQQSPYQI